MPDDIAVDQVLALSELLPEQHFTKPPRYTEASLVKELEAQGIGRPSTYAQIITTIQDREYVEKVDNRYFLATERGHTVNKLLVETFPHIFNVRFTADMEDKLDRIEEGQDNWVDTVRQFYASWKDDLKDANERRKELKQALQEESDIECEECGRMMVVNGVATVVFSPVLDIPNARIQSRLKSRNRSRQTRCAISVSLQWSSKRAAMAAFSPAALIPTAGTSNPSTWVYPVRKTTVEVRSSRSSRVKGKCSTVVTSILPASLPVGKSPLHRRANTAAQDCFTKRAVGAAHPLYTARSAERSAKKARAHRRLKHPV